MIVNRRTMVGLLPLMASSAKAQRIAQAIAQNSDDAGWPKRAIRFILSSAPGSAGDVVCRIVAQKLGKRLDQQLIMDNRPAVGGTLAAEALARSAPDGYTIGMVTTSTHVIAKIIDPHLPYDPVKDFLPISMLGSSPYVLAVYPGLPVKTVADLIALAKSKTQPLNNAAYGTTSLGYLASLLFAQQAGIRLNEISYRSSAQAVIDVMEGRVEMQFSTLPPAMPQLAAGKLRALATTGARRVPALPNVPTLAESGFPGFDVALWIGVAAPAGTPPDIVATLNREITAILSEPDTRAAYAQQAFVTEPGPPDYLAGRIGGDPKIWQGIVAKNDIATQQR
jgi:tripartite-type tricarboxylate transporter receptor subunit TctC